jgi:hypothetical protein
MTNQNTKGKRKKSENAECFPKSGGRSVSVLNFRFHSNLKIVITFLRKISTYGVS